MAEQRRPVDPIAAALVVAIRRAVQRRLEEEAERRRTITIVKAPTNGRNAA